MLPFLMIENPGVCGFEGFILLGNTSHHDESNPFVIGQFGSGSKHATGVLLRNGLSPIVFCGNHKLEFFTKAGTMQAVKKDTDYARICVKHGGKDEKGASVTFTEETSQTVNYGYKDWDSVAMGLREYVSNALDAAIAMNEDKWASEDHGGLKTPWDGVKVEIVDENRVRAKASHTRVFIPLTNERLGEGQAVILNFYNALGKWFLHFGEPDLLLTGMTILPKRNRNLGEKLTAVIYRCGVRVREVGSDWSENQESLFDYNLNDLKVDESRNVSDSTCRDAAATEMAKADAGVLSVLFRSFRDETAKWEWGFGSYELRGYSDTTKQLQVKEQAWSLALSSLGENSILATKDTPRDLLENKGYQVVEAPDAFVRAATAYGVLTPERVLNEDERSGRELVEPTPDAVAAVNWVWDLLEFAGMTGGKEKPLVKCFRSQMDGGSIRMGFYRDGIVYISEDYASGSGVELRQIALEEVAHYVTGSTDCSRDFQDFAFKFAVRSWM